MLLGSPAFGWDVADRRLDVVGDPLLGSDPEPSPNPRPPLGCRGCWTGSGGAEGQQASFLKLGVRKFWGDIFKEHSTTSGGIELKPNVINVAGLGPRWS